MQDSAEASGVIGDFPSSLKRRQTPDAGALRGEWSAAERLRRLFHEELASTPNRRASLRSHRAGGPASGTNSGPGGLPDKAILTNLLLLGRNSGEFETNTPLEEVSGSLMIILRIFSLSLQSSSARGSLDERSARLMDLALRSLSCKFAGTDLAGR